MRRSVVDELADVDAFGLGAFGEVVAHAGLQIHGQLERSVLAEELAALGLAEIVRALHRCLVQFRPFRVPIHRDIGRHIVEF